MIRTAVLFLLCFTLGAEVHAQEPVSYGLKLGVTGAREYLEGNSFGERWLAPNAGFFADVPVRGIFGLLGEIAYEQKGAHFDEYRDYENNRTENVDFRYHYASTLVAARLRRALSGGHIVPYVFAGPRIDALIAEGVASEDGDFMNEERDASRFVFGARAGIGAELLGVIGFPVVVELRYDRDLASAVEWTFLGVDRSVTIEYRTIGVRVGVLF